MSNPKDDERCVSSIDQSLVRDGCARFLWTIRTWIHFHPAGEQRGGAGTGRVFRLEDWTDAERDFFKKRFALEIASGWGNGAIWLAHSRPEKVSPFLWCDVKVEYVSERKDAHLCVNAVNKPVLIRYTGDANRGGYRGSCDPKGGNSVDGYSDAPEMKKNANHIDMHIPNKDVVSPPTVREDVATSDAGDVTIKQNVLWHEFGHYLGLQHTCLGQGGDKEGYCGGLTKEKQENLMAKGNKFVTAHAKPFADRLKQHADYVQSHHNVFWFVAKNINSSPGGGDRQSRPWKGTSWEQTIKAFQMG